MSFCVRVHNSSNPETDRNTKNMQHTRERRKLMQKMYSEPSARWFWTTETKLVTVVVVVVVIVCGLAQFLVHLLYDSLAATNCNELYVRWRQRQREQKNRANIMRTHCIERREWIRCDFSPFFLFIHFSVECVLCVPFAVVSCLRVDSGG